MSSERYCVPTRLQHDAQTIDGKHHKQKFAQGLASYFFVVATRTNKLDKHRAPNTHFC